MVYFIHYGGINEKNEINMFFFPPHAIEEAKFILGFDANNMLSHIGYQALNILLPLKQPMTISNSYYFLIL